ncbi:Protein LemA [Pseudoclavibacter triregionum]|nr:Protein LemA [Pseudoclavibacter triregionum]
MNDWLWIVLAAAALLIVIALLVVASGRGGVRRATARVDGAWAELEGHVADRGSRITELLGRLEAAAPQESKAIRALASANEAALQAGTPSALGAAEPEVHSALRTVLHVADGYPALVQSPDFLELRNGIAAENDRIQASRRFYNGSVREYNTKISTFPGSLAAGKASEREIFEAADKLAIAEPPRVQF